MTICAVCAVLSRSVMSDSLQPHGLWPTRLLCPWDSPGKNNEVGNHSLLQGVFPTQGLNPGLLHCRQILCQLSHQGSPPYFLLPLNPERDASRPGLHLEQERGFSLHFWEKFFLLEVRSWRSPRELWQLSAFKALFSESNSADPASSVGGVGVGGCVFISIRKKQIRKL